MRVRFNSEGEKAQLLAVDVLLCTVVGAFFFTRLTCVHFLRL